MSLVRALLAFLLGYAFKGVSLLLAVAIVIGLYSKESVPVNAEVSATPSENGAHARFDGTAVRVTLTSPAGTEVRPSYIIQDASGRELMTLFISNTGTLSFNLRNDHDTLAAGTVKLNGMVDLHANNPDHAVELQMRPENISILDIRRVNGGSLEHMRITPSGIDPGPRVDATHYRN